METPLRIIRDYGPLQSTSQRHLNTSWTTTPNILIAEHVCWANFSRKRPRKGTVVTVHRRRNLVTRSLPTIYIIIPRGAKVLPETWIHYSYMIARPRGSIAIQSEASLPMAHTTEFCNLWDHIKELNMHILMIVVLLKQPCGN